MAVVELIYDVKDYSYITSNPTKILSNGEPIYLNDGRFGFGDGVTTLSALPLFGSATTWGSITGTLSNQTDLQTALNGKQNTITAGTTSQYLRGDLSLATFPTNVSSFTNDSGYITSSALSPYLTIANAALTYQPIGSYLTGLTVGSTAIGSGTNTRILYNNAGVLGEYTVTGTGTTAVLSTSPTFTTDITTPKILGGSAVGSAIQYQGTSGNGTSTIAAHQFLVGNNGATTALSIFNNGTSNFGGITQNTTGLGILRVQQGTAAIDLGDYASNSPAIWINKTPSSTNYSFAATATSTIINCETTGSISFSINTTERMAIRYYSLTTNFANLGTGSQLVYDLRIPNITGQTASTNIPNFKVTGSTKTWAAGTLATQYFNYFSANTVAFASASTATNVYGLYVEAATAGTNATITNNYAAGFNGGNGIQIQTGSIVGNGIVIRNLVGSATNSAIYMGVTPSSTNHALRGDAAGNTFVNGGAVFVAIGGTTMLAMNGNSASFQSFNAATSGAVTSYTLNNPNHTGQTASTNIPNFKVTGSTKTWAGSAGAATLGTQYFNYFTANTVAFANANTATMPVNLYIEAPLAGTNCTATNLAALGIGGHCFIANSVGVPANNPTGGGLLYVEAGALKYRGSSGTVTTIAAA